MILGRKIAMKQTYTDFLKSIIFLVPLALDSMPLEWILKYSYHLRIAWSWSIRDLKSDLVKQDRIYFSITEKIPGLIFWYLNVVSVPYLSFVFHPQSFIIQLHMQHSRPGRWKSKGYPNLISLYPFLLRRFGRRVSHTTSSKETGKYRWAHCFFQQYINLIRKTN